MINHNIIFILKIMLVKKLLEIRLGVCLQVCKHQSYIRYISKNVIKSSSRADFRMAPHVFRQKKMYSAVVQNVRNASPTIKILRLLVKEPGFSFKAGQWVDFYVPGISEVTGYSMTSPPKDAKEKGILELSVKYGKFPPTHWLHTECCGGEEVQIRVGGDFFYDPFSNRTEAEADLLLVGGGVGINPLVSILCEYTDFLTAANLENSDIKPGKVHLLYSGRTEEELVFKDTFTIMEAEFPSLTCQYFVTREVECGPKPGIKFTRIEKEDVLNSIKKLQPEKTMCYVCGPSTMTDDVANWLYTIGVKKDYVRYEKWW